MATEDVTDEEDDAGSFVSAMDDDEDSKYTNSTYLYKWHLLWAILSLRGRFLRARFRV